MCPARSAPVRSKQTSAAQTSAFQPRNSEVDARKPAPEATAGIEPAMKVLQTSALPLGYVAQEPQERACSLSVATTATGPEGPTVATDVAKSNEEQQLTLF